MFNGKFHFFDWVISIAMLNYQRVPDGFQKFQGGFFGDVFWDFFPILGRLEDTQNMAILMEHVWEYLDYPEDLGVVRAYLTILAVSLRNTFQQSDVAVEYQPFK